MDIPHEDEYDFIMYIKIDEIRMLYDHICYSIKMWPGSPARPVEEQEYLIQLKNRLFAMIADYSFSQLDIDN
tara:strand:+ start:1031 stop:1246 length:216 start_codon:yes stop_codon:yes gene_type:complete